MIKKFSIRNFKCFREITIKSWERINLVAGKNNVGKTALLEAIWLHEGAHNAQLAFAVQKFRGINAFDSKNFLKELFAEFRTGPGITLEAEYQDGKSLGLRILQEEAGEPVPIDTETVESGSTRSVSPKLIFEATEGGNVLCKSEFFLGVDAGDPQGKLIPFFLGGHQSLRPTAVFVSSGLSKEERNKVNGTRFSEQVEKKRKGEILDSLRLICPELKKIDLSKRGNEFYVGGDIGYDRMLPLSLMGEGVERYLTFVLSILFGENGIVLIDEIENGFHYSIYNKIWRNLARLARKYNVQIIATTHSHECVEAAHKSFKEDEKYDFLLHRLDRVGDSLDDVTYDQETLEVALNTDLEVR